MPKKSKPSTKAVATPELNVQKELLDQLVSGPMTQGDLETMFRSLKKAVIERAMKAEMSDHLGYESGESKPAGQVNQRNGVSGKTVITDEGPLRIDVPRDRQGSFEPQIIGKHERRFTGFDQKIVAMYARGMTVREIQGYLAEMYGTEVSPDFISKVTDEVMAEVIAWQSRPLEPMYPVVFFDALRVKIRDDAVVRNKPVYLALAVLPDGARRARYLDRADRRREVLAQSVQRTAQLRRRRHPHRRRRRSEGAGRGHRDRVSPDNGADLHCASDP
jgi:putative transposase